VSINTIGALHGTVSQGGHTELVTFQGQATGSGAFDPAKDRIYREGFDYEVGVSVPPYDLGGPTLLSDGSFGFFGGLISGAGWSENYEWVPGASYSGFGVDAQLMADKTHSFRAHGALHEYTEGEALVFVATHVGGNLAFKTDAVSLTFSGAPSSGSITAAAAQLSQSFFPNTDESTATARFQYRKLGASTWIESVSQNYSGYGIQTRTVTVSGLDGSTTYEYRLRVTRATNNGTDNFGTIGTFTTLADAPSVVTDPASNVGPNGATLNATVNPAGISDVDYRFAYDVDSGAPYASATAWTALGLSDSSPHQVSTPITGLSASTPYFFRAEVRWSGGTLTAVGSERSFTTEATAEEAPNVQIHEKQGKYGVASTFYFTALVPSGTNSNRFFNAAVPWIAGDVLVVKDGGTPTNIGTLPTRVGTSPLYTLTLTAAEMSATDIQVYLVDADGPAWRDTIIHIETKQRLGKLDIDASQIGTTEQAVTLASGATAAGDLTGVLASHVVRRSTATGGGASTITLDASASATSEFYAGATISIISGTGAGQSRTILSYDGGSKVATVNRGWVANPANGSVFLITRTEDVWANAAYAEAAAIPTAASSPLTKLQALFQRFFFRRKEDATTLTLYKADSTTPLGTGSNTDSAGVQDLGKLS